MGLARGLAFVIAVEQRVDLIHGKFAFDVTARQVVEVLGGSEPIDGLQTDGRAPSISGFALCGFSLPDISVEIYVSLFFGHGGVILNQASKIRNFGGLWVAFSLFYSRFSKRVMPNVGLCVGGHLWQRRNASKKGVPFFLRRPISQIYEIWVCNI